jgi:RES domain
VSAVCWRCIEDEYLKNMVRDDGTPRECSLCKRTDANAFAPDEMAHVVAPVIRLFFIQEPDAYKSGDDDSGVEITIGDLSCHLPTVIGQYLGFEGEIIDALEANENAARRDGERFFDRSLTYVRVPRERNRYSHAWYDVHYQLKHRRRFFSDSARQLFTDLLGGIENRVGSATAKENRNAVCEFPQGSEIYRARICKSEKDINDSLSEPFKNVGPPPPEKASAGRMNPEGIPVFYGSLNWETCLAETRPAIGNDTAVIKLMTTKPLRLLDFSRLGGSSTRLSYFEPDFLVQRERGAFLKRLQWLISQPIVPGKEPDYIITQTLAEYLAHVHEHPFDGMLFNSAQRLTGMNIVLFPDAGGGFPLTYVDNSIKLYCTRLIEYAHEEHLVLEMDGKFIVYPDDEETYLDYDNLYPAQEDEG